MVEIYQFQDEFGRISGSKRSFSVCTTVSQLQLIHRLYCLCHVDSPWCLLYYSSIFRLEVYIVPFYNLWYLVIVR